MNFTYTVDENNTVRIFDGINEEPFIFQPHQPDGSEFTAETANAWANEFIEGWQIQYEENQNRIALKESAKAKLIAGQPLTAEEAEVIII